MKLNLHLVSDSTGEVLGVMSRTISSHLDINIQEFTWTLVRTSSQLDEAKAGILKNNGIVFYAIFSEDIESNLKDFLSHNQISYTNVLKHPIAQISKYTNTPNIMKRKHYAVDIYSERVEAIEYTINHDDGAITTDLEDADVILLGPSRTSKTPVSVYLAYKGLKVANIPIVPISGEHQDYFDISYLKTLAKPLLIGLIINPDRLEKIRKERTNHIGDVNNETYANVETIASEIKIARQIYAKLGCHVIDVTQKSVEETSAIISAVLSKRSFVG